MKSHGAVECAREQKDTCSVCVCADVHAGPCTESVRGGSSIMELGSTYDAWEFSGTQSEHGERELSLWSPKQSADRRSGHAFHCKQTYAEKQSNAEKKVTDS